MAMFGLSEVFGHLKGEMAKSRATIKKLADEELVTSYSGLLIGAGSDRESFDRVFESIKADDRLKSPDIVAIAQRYNGGGKKPSSKAMALAAISKRFVEIVRFHAKNKVAERVRPW